MPYRDPQKRRQVVRESKRRQRARQRENVAETLPAAPSPVTDLEDFIETLVIGQGPLQGQPFKLLDWERQFLRGAFADGIDAGALSIGRGNGKSSLVAAIAAAAIVGPLAQPRAEVVAVASSFSQAKIIYQHTLDYVGPWLKAHPERYRVLDSQSAAVIADRVTGSALKCIGSDPARSHGLAPALVLLDEGAVWPANYSDKMYSSMQTSMGKIAGARLIALGTRPASGAHWFSRLLEGGDGIYAQSHHAPPHAALDDPEAWRAANPSLTAFPELQKAVAREAVRAIADPSLVPQFKALRLNEGVADTMSATLIDPASWARCEVDELPLRTGAMILGIDLGAAQAMTGAVAYWPSSGRLEAAAWFPMIPSLGERGLHDGVGDTYELLAAVGQLFTMPGRTVNVGEAIRWVCTTWGRPAVVVADRFKQAELLQAAEDSSLPCPIVFRGMGWRDGGEDVRLFQRAVLDGRVSAPRSLLIRGALEEAVVVLDGAGNGKLAKGHEGGRRIRHRDDVVAAAILAVGEGMRRGDRRPRKRRWAIA